MTVTKCFREKVRLVRRTEASFILSCRNVNTYEYFPNPFPTADMTDRFWYSFILSSDKAPEIPP